MIGEKLFPKFNIMSAILTHLTESQFEEHILPFLRTARRGYKCSIPLFKVFNYILYRLHTGCQWEQLPVAAAPGEPTKKNQLAGGVLPFSQMEP